MKTVLVWTTLAGSLFGTAIAQDSTTKKTAPKSPPGVAKTDARPRFSRFLEAMKNRPNAMKAAELPKNLKAIPSRKSKEGGILKLDREKPSGIALTPTSIDQRAAQNQSSSSSTRISDEAFVRRVYLDLIGEIPAPADVTEYVRDQNPDKAEKLVDRLIALPQFGDHWARYWRDTISYRATAGQNRDRAFDGANWLAAEINKGTPWNSIVMAMLTATGQSDENPQGFFFGAHEEPAEMAGEAARIFNGIQISCAQCHDHPTDTWKREQFHEMAAFFGKTVVRLRPDLSREKGRPIVMVSANPRPGKEYMMPDKDDPSKPGTVMTPKYLTGQSIPLNTTDAQRRQSLAAFITNERNPYFAKSVVNRLWLELMGDTFTPAVDDLGDSQEVKQPELFTYLSRAFAASKYEFKKLIKTIVLTDSYRKASGTELGSAEDQPNRLVRLSSHQLFSALDTVLGGMDDGRPNAPRRPNSRTQFEMLFGFDPSMPRDEIEGAIPQALFLMNNLFLNRRISSDNDTLVKKLLATPISDRELISRLYLKVLGRKPTDKERDVAESFLSQEGNRREAVEDLLWSLLNTTEFLYQR